MVVFGRNNFNWVVLQSELAHAHTDEIDALKKQHRRELRKMSEEMMTNNSEAELRKEMAEMAVKSSEPFDSFRSSTVHGSPENN